MRQRNWYDDRGRLRSEEQIARDWMGRNREAALAALRIEARGGERPRAFPRFEVVEDVPLGRRMVRVLPPSPDAPAG